MFTTFFVAYRNATALSQQSETTTANTVAAGLSTVSVLRDSAITTANVVSFAAEITCVTTGTVGRVLRLIRIRNRFSIGSMAVSTRRFTRSMVTWINTTASRGALTANIAIRTVIKGPLIRPGSRYMTCNAVHSGNEVTIRWLASCTITMTTGPCTIVGNAGVVKLCTHEGTRFMAGATIRCGHDVVNRIVLAGRTSTTIHMTGIAPGSVGHSAMVEYTADEGIGVVTDTTVLIGLNVGSASFIRLTRSVYTIVAGLASTPTDLGAGMREIPRYETSGLMAHIAIIIGRYVIVGFARRGIAVVTGNTITRYTLMIKGGTGKVRGVMTDTAVLTCSCVGYTRPGQSRILTGCIRTVMTGLTYDVSGHIAMVEYRFRPGTTANMADFTVVTICRRCVCVT